MFARSHGATLKGSTCRKSASWLWLLTECIQYVPLFVVLCNPRLHLFLTSNQPCPSLTQYMDARAQTRTRVYVRAHAGLVRNLSGLAERVCQKLSTVITPPSQPFFAAPRLRTNRIYGKNTHKLWKPMSTYRVVWLLSGCRFALNWRAFPWESHIYSGAAKYRKWILWNFPHNPHQDFYLKM